MLWIFVVSVVGYVIWNQTKKRSLQEHQSLVLRENSRYSQFKELGFAVKEVIPIVDERPEEGTFAYELGLLGRGRKGSLSLHLCGQVALEQTVLEPGLRPVSSERSSFFVDTADPTLTLIACQISIDAELWEGIHCRCEPWHRAANEPYLFRFEWSTREGEVFLNDRKLETKVFFKGKEEALVPFLDEHTRECIADWSERSIRWLLDPGLGSLLLWFVKPISQCPKREVIDLVREGLALVESWEKRRKQSTPIKLLMNQSLSDLSEHYRELAFDTLGESFGKEPSVQQFLTKSLDSKDLHTKLSAAWWLGERGIPVLVGWIEDRHSDETLRVKSLETLAKLDPQGSWEKKLTRWMEPLSPDFLRRLSICVMTATSKRYATSA